jgi:hypothetical protein
MAGATGSKSGIADGGHQNTIGGDEDAFLAKLNSSGVRQWATYFGGADTDWGYGCATGSANNVYLAGYTESTSGIADGGHQNTKSVGDDGFLAKFRGVGIGLPVTLVSFAAQCQPGGTLLHWQTAQEVNNKQFEVQRSQTAASWQTIAMVKGAGTTSQPQAYSWTDKNPPTGVQYYRLKQVDYDGTITYSNIVTTTCGQPTTSGLQVYPNPVVSGSGFRVVSPANQTYSIINARGQVLQNGILQKGANSLALRGVAAGIYLLKTAGDQYRIVVQ